MKTSKKLELLQSNNEDYEWYPTTEEIIEAVKTDLLKYGITHYHELMESGIQPKKHYNDTSGQETYLLSIDTMLDIGAGDGRVLKALGADEQYAIEIARAQADDLIKQGIFLIGRDFYHVDLMMDTYSLIFCNPPYSQYEAWAKAIITYANFDVLYLVLPVRWEHTGSKKTIEQHYDYRIIGEYDFSHAERQARAKVHVIRINRKWHKVKIGNGYAQEALEDAFSRWVYENIGDFPEEEKYNYEKSISRARIKGTEIALKQKTIDQLLDDYEREKDTLFKAFQVIGGLPNDVIKMMGQDKKSMLAILRKSIKNLKYKYWKEAFEKLEAINDRLTKNSINKIINDREIFTRLDFNVENVYSITIWIIEHANQYIMEQIEQVFDTLSNTDPDYIRPYKSNEHWIQSNWRYTRPEKYKLGTLDYRIITRCYKNTYTYPYTGYDRTPLSDFMVVCKNLGFSFAPDSDFNLDIQRSEQKIYLEDGNIAFSLRFYQGKQTAHLKINKDILLKFNIEVAKIKKWITGEQDIVDEFDVTADEAAALWNASLQLIGKNDLKLIGTVAG